MSDRLFTPRFFIMFAYSVAVYVSLFQLLPAAPYRVLGLGGTTAAAGLFLGFLTYSSAISAPFTGPIGDRLGHRQVLIVVSLVLAVCTASYAFISDYRLLLAVVVVHGLFWSALLAASGAYMTSTVPVHRRAEGLGYWGLSSVFAIAVAPSIGFWVYTHGWFALCAELVILNLLMAFIAWRLPEDAGVRSLPLASRAISGNSGFRDANGKDLTPANAAGRIAAAVEWRVMLLSITLAMVSFGYGGLTSFSALFADELGVWPRSAFLTSMAVAILLGRLTIGRTLDRLGHRRVLLPALLAPSLGLVVLAAAQGQATLILAGLAFGSGFGLMYPAYTAYVMDHVAFNRRGAAFGAMLAAFDTGVGTGSSAIGWIAHRAGFRPAFLVAAGIAALSLPCFLYAERRLGFKGAR